MLTHLTGKKPVLQAVFKRVKSSASAHIQRQGINHLTHVSPTLVI